MITLCDNWTYTSPPSGRARLDHLIDAVWSYYQWQCSDAVHSAFPVQLDSIEQLANLLYPAFQAGLCTDEGRLARLRIAFNPKPKRLTVAFTKPRRYSSSELIKLAPTIGLGQRWLVATPDHRENDSIVMDGIYDPDVLPPHRGNQVWGSHVVSFRDYLLPSLKVSMLGPGWVRVSAFHHAFELRDCSFQSPLLVGHIKHMNDWIREIPGKLAIEDKTGIASSRALARQFIMNSLARIIDMRHGGCVLIVPDDADVKGLPLNVKYPTDCDSVQNTIKRRAAVEPTPWAERCGSESSDDAGSSSGHMHASTVPDALLLDRDLLQITDCFAALASVDGAVLLRRDLRLLGFGAEITLVGDSTADELVEFGTHRAAPEGGAAVPLVEFGMRHRSAARFCQAVPGAMAFVISQDGGLRLFQNVDGVLRQWVNLTAAEW